MRIALGRYSPRYPQRIRPNPAWGSRLASGSQDASEYGTHSVEGVDSTHRAGITAVGKIHGRAEHHPAKSEITTLTTVGYLHLGCAGTCPTPLPTALQL